MVPVPAEMVAQIQKIAGIMERISVLEAALRMPQLIGTRKPYYTLSQACEARGVSYGTLRHEKARQPHGGVADFTSGTRRYWTAESVSSWDPAPVRPKLRERSAS